MKKNKQVVFFASSEEAGEGDEDEVEAEAVEAGEAEAEESNYFFVERSKELTVTAKADSDPVAYGTEVNITATVSGEYGNVSYQWYMSKDGGATWKKTALEGNKSDALIFTATSTLMKYYFR